MSTKIFGNEIKTSNHANNAQDQTLVFGLEFVYMR